MLFVNVKSGMPYSACMQEGAEASLDPWPSGADSEGGSVCPDPPLDFCMCKI